MISCASFLEPRKSKLGPSKSTFNAQKFIACHADIIYAACLCLPQSISAQFALEMCLTARNRQKIHVQWSSMVTEFGANREPVYDFLLVISSNLGPISHHFWDTATYWLKVANVPYPLSLSTPTRYDPFQIYRKALRTLKLKSSRQPMVKIWWS